LKGHAKKVSSFEKPRSRASAFASITWKVEQLLQERCTGKGLLLAKGCVEDKLFLLADRVAYMIMRLSSVYGEFEGETRTRLIPHLVLDALRDIQVFVSGPTRKLDFVHMSDVLSAIMKGIGYLCHLVFSPIFYFEPFLKVSWSLTLQKTRFATATG